MKTLVVERKRISDGKTVYVKTKSETTFVYLKIANSIEAFIISKQRAIKADCNLVNIELNQKIEIEEEDEEADANRNQQ